MLDSETVAFIPSWKKMKDAQWERFQGTIPGLQLVKSGDWQHQYMLICSVDASEGEPGFYEGVIIGQFPELAIDLSDEEIGQVIERWAVRKSAIDLAFIPAVWGRDGRPRTARCNGG